MKLKITMMVVMQHSKLSNLHIYIILGMMKMKLPFHQNIYMFSFLTTELAELDTNNNFH